MTDEVANLVGGRWIGASTGELIDRTNPADTSEVVVRYPAMTSQDAEAAVAAAADGFAAWRRTGLLDRGRILLSAAAILSDRRDDIAADITAEMGKTLAEARAEVAASIAFLEYYGGLARVSQGEILADRREDVNTFTRREPVGVVVLITPWNDPLLTPARKLAPALIAGNSVVLKPAPETPLSATHLACALFDAGVPAGVLNTVTGRVADVGPPLLSDPAVAAVSFTGSTAVGMELSRRLAGRAVRIQTEMGGKNAALVLADADLDAAVDAIVGAGFGQAGQRCTATSRVIVQTEVHDAVVDRLVARAGDLRLGRGADESTQMGPLVTEGHLDGVLAAVEKAVAEGATLAAGGARGRTAPLDRGHFLAPTVLTGVTAAMDVWQSELFGPVIAVSSVGSFEEGVEAVNASRYGLAAAVFTRDLGHAHRFVEAVDTGQVAVNLPTSGWDVHIPFGGFKESGSAFKEHGTEGLRFYTRVKTVALGYS
jgi:alpha-ketoglutaric semialdehyde dehydrogenase